jgi:hypothetical protein
MQCLVTHNSARWPLTSMSALMFLQIGLLTEWLITHITVEWPLTTMSALMCLQIVLQTEWLITHITVEWPLTAMNALMSLQTGLPTEWLITHITVASRAWLVAVINRKDNLGGLHHSLVTNCLNWIIMYMMLHFQKSKLKKYQKRS